MLIDWIVCSGFVPAIKCGIVPYHFPYKHPAAVGVNLQDLKVQELFVSVCTKRTCQLWCFLYSDVLLILAASVFHATYSISLGIGWLSLYC